MSPSSAIEILGSDTPSTVTVGNKLHTGHARVIKTVKGGSLAGATTSADGFRFQLRSGASSTHARSVLETQVVGRATPGGAASFAANLTPNQTYQI